MIEVAGGVLIAASISAVFGFGVWSLNEVARNPGHEWRAGGAVPGAAWTLIWLSIGVAIGIVYAGA